VECTSIGWKMAQSLTGLLTPYLQLVPVPRQHRYSGWGTCVTYCVSRATLQLSFSQAVSRLRAKLLTPGRVVAFRSHAESLCPFPPIHYLRDGPARQASCDQGGDSQTSLRSEKSATMQSAGAVHSANSVAVRGINGLTHTQLGRRKSASARVVQARKQSRLVVNIGKRARSRQ
jgi:hypothetical protein